MSLSFGAKQTFSRTYVFGSQSRALRGTYANLKPSVGTSADAARKSACATMKSALYRIVRKLSDIGHSCLPCRDSSRHLLTVETLCRAKASARVPTRQARVPGTSARATSSCLNTCEKCRLTKRLTTCPTFHQQ